MDAECFGGEESTQYGAYPRGGGTSSSNGHQQQQQQQQHGNSAPASGAGGGVKREKTRNAFMLVYDRAVPDDGQPAGGGGEGGGEEDQHLPRRSPMSPSSSTSSSVSSSSLSPTSPPTPIAGSAALPGTDASLVTVGKGDDLLAGGRGRVAAMVGAQADRGVDIQRFAAEGGRGARGRERRKRFRAKVPAVFMRQIHQENLEFWRFVWL